MKFNTLHGSFVEAFNNYTAEAALLLKEPADELESDVMRQAFRNSDIISV